MIHHHRKKMRDHFSCWTPACALDPPACLSLALTPRLPYDRQGFFALKLVIKLPLTSLGVAYLKILGSVEKKGTQEFFWRCSTLKISEKYLQLPCLLLSDFLKAQFLKKSGVFLIKL